MTPALGSRLRRYLFFRRCLFLCCHPVGICFSTRNVCRELPPASRLRRRLSLCCHPIGICFSAENVHTSNRSPSPLFFSTLPNPDDLPLPPLALAEGDAIALPPTDETPNSAPPDPSTRVPHLGHALLFIAITTLFLILSQALALLAGHPTHPLDIDPRLLIASEAVAYLLTLTAAFFVFPPLWQRPFLLGLQWNGPAATRNAIRLIPLGLLLSAIVQGLSNYIDVPKELPIDAFFHTRSTVWLITVFGTVLAPLFEEVLFRGFLLPAFAIAYDWLCLPRTEAARASWQSSNAITRNALVFSAVLTSVLFALVHGKQTAFTWPILALLFCVSLILTSVRIRLRSVAASTVIHASYNFTVFLAAFITTGGYQHLDKLPK